MYNEPQMEITRFEENEVATDVAIASGHRPGNGDIWYDDLV
jgi:hypothetical protein